MGGYLTKVDEQVQKSLQTEYQVETQPYLLHKQTQQLCTLHKITANSAGQAQTVTHIIEQYNRSKCESISKLRSHYRVDNTGYCSQEQRFYLVFEGQNNYTVRDQIAKRRAYQSAFNDKEIQKILAAALSGLREYDMRFQRNYERLSFEDLMVDQRNNRLYLKDPWLKSSNSTENSNNTPVSVDYPSPQKLNATYVNKLETFNQFLSNLFTIGVMGLYLNKVNSAQAIYIRKREINRQQIKNRVIEINNNILRRGVECLLSQNPAQRRNIYQLWGIQNKQVHYIEPILTQKGQSLNSPTSSNRVEAYNKTSKFQFPPTFQLLPSEVIVPPLQLLQLNQKKVNLPNPPSTRSNPTNRAQVQDSLTPIPKFVSNNLTSTPIPPQQTYSFKLPIYKPVCNTSILNKTVQNFAFKPIIDNKALNFHDMLAVQQQKISSNYSNYVRPLQTFKPFSLYSKIPQVKINEKPAVNIPPKIDCTFTIQKAESRFIPPVDLISKSPMKEQPVKNIEKSKANQNDIEIPPAISILLQAKAEYQDAVNATPNIQKIEQNSSQQAQAQQHISNIQTKEQKVHTNPLKMINENSKDLNLTPVRPTIKNKYNSTIIQVRQDESPAHSQQSGQGDQPEQYVIQEYQSGSRYQGFKANGMRNGRGKFYYQDGGYYEGSWKNNKMDGYGKLYYEGGKLAYEGYWLQDQFNGLGKVYNDNPIPLNGPFGYHDFQLLDEYWEYYEGILVHDVKQGRGKIKLTNDEIFEGDFHNDRIQGFGKFHTLDGKIIEGIWRDSRLVKVINNTRE